MKKTAGLEIIPSKWGVLYLKGNHRLEKPFQFFNRKEEPIESMPLDGIIVLDGSWKQAHSTWWRNPWLLRVNRIAPHLPHPSCRNQAAAAGLATIESNAHALRHLNEDPAGSESLIRQYEDFNISPKSLDSDQN